MPGQRKLFLAHASELAYRFVRAVRRDGLVAQFVRSYADRHNRPGRSLSPERNREFDSTIGRETLLVIAAKVRNLVPAAFASERNRGKSRRNTAPKLSPEESALSVAFYAEFLASLGRSLEWPPAEAAAESDAFRRDLEMYQRWSSRSVLALLGTDGPGQSPFADRCAILLDPAMMEQARRAAAEFEIEIERTAARMFSQLGRRAGVRKQSPHRPEPHRRINPNASRKSAAPSTRKKKSPRGRKPKSARRSAHGVRGPRHQKPLTPVRRARGHKPKKR
jgi:hypothetical protein